MEKVNINELKINKTLLDFINQEVLPETDINEKDFWIKFSKVVHELSPINKALIERGSQL